MYHERNSNYEGMFGLYRQSGQEGCYKGNEYRVVMFAIDHLNFIECTKVVCLCGFHKKSNKDYKKATRQAEKILSDYLKQN